MKNLLTLLLFFLSGCISTSHDLGSGYILGYETDNLDRIIYLNKTYGGALVTYFEDSTKKNRFFKNEEGIVTSYVSQVAVTDKYILVDQKPIGSICDCNFDYFHKKYGDSDQIGFIQRCNDGIKNSFVHLFYIIDKEKNIVSQPMSKKELDEKCQELGINKNLKFRFTSY